MKNARHCIHRFRLSHCSRHSHLFFWHLFFRYFPLGRHYISPPCPPAGGQGGLLLPLLFPCAPPVRKSGRAARGYFAFLPSKKCFRAEAGFQNIRPPQKRRSNVICPYFLLDLSFFLLPLREARSTSSTFLSEGFTTNSTTMTMASAPEMENSTTEVTLFWSQSLLAGI